MSRHWGKKRDKSSREIIEALESFGCLVYDIDGKVDLLVKDHQSGRQELVDCKTTRAAGGRETLTDAQKAMLADGWEIFFPKSADEAIAMVTDWRRK